MYELFEKLLCPKCGTPLVKKKSKRASTRPYECKNEDCPVIEVGFNISFDSMLTIKKDKIPYV